MESGKPTYEELQARLFEAESILESIRAGKVDVLMGETQPLVIRLKSVSEEKEKLLRENHQLAHEWSLTFNAIDSLIWLLDKDNTVIRSNKDSFAGLISPTENPVGKNYFDIIDCPDEQSSGCPFERAKKSLHRERMELKVGDKWFDIVVDPIIANGEFQGAIHIASDITDRKKAEQKLKENEQLLEAFFSQSLDGFFFMMLDEPVAWNDSVDKEKMLDYVFEHQRITKANAAMLNQYLATEEQFLGLTPHQLFSHDIKHGRDTWREFFDRGTLHIDTHEKKLDGSDMIIEGDYICLYDSQGRITGHFGAQRDVTEYRNAQEKIRTLGKAIEQNPVSIMITDKNGYFTYVNPAFESSTGFSFSEIKGETPRILKSDEHSLNFYKELWDTILSGDVWNGEFRNKRKNGELYWDKSIISPIFNSKNEISHFVAVQQDITQQKLLLEELVAAKEKAEESDRLKSAFLANISHEIRTPMNGILGFAELLKEPQLTGKQQNEYIDIINRSGQRMLNIINDIVDISKIESGLVELRVSETNINEQIKFAYSFFKPEADKKGIQLSYKTALSDNEALLKTDREKLYAILINLIKNALKYTDNGTIEFGYTVKKSNHPSCIEFFVADTGIGIPKDRQEAIFERFIQADISDKRAYQGAGLGLSISKAYIEMLGGKIWVESEEGKGSTFYFTLPFSNENPSKIAEKEGNSGNNNEIAKKLKILIAEDDESSQQFLTIILQPLCSELLIAQNGVEAVNICKTHPDIDLVLMDIQMPVLNGYEATRQIRLFNKEVIIIAQTAFALSGDDEKAKKAGCNGYISKPIYKSKLVSIIKDHFKEH